MATFSIGGLATGLDMNTILEQLRLYERQPVVRLQEQQEKLQTKRDAWQDIKMYLNNLKSKTSDLKSQGTFRSYSVSTSSSDCFSVSASSATELGTYNLEIISLASCHSVVSKSGQDIAWDAVSGEIYITVGSEEPVTINVNGMTSLVELRDAINSVVPNGTASIIDNRLVIASKNAGTDNMLSFSDSSGTDAVLKELGIVTDTGNLNELSSATNAEFKINGLLVTRSSNTISDVIDGVSIILKKKTQGVETFEITQDIEKAKSAIKAFVDQINSALSFIQSKLDAGSPKDHKSAGALVSDSTLMRIQTELRRLVSDTVQDISGKYKTVSQIGIQLDRYGSLTLDNEKLTKALEENPEDVYQLFVTESDDNSGVAQRLDAYIKHLTASKDGIIDVKTKALDNSMKTFRDSIEKMEKRVEQRMAMIEKQFLALEVAMAKMQSQQNWLSSQVNMLYGSKGIS